MSATIASQLSHVYPLGTRVNERGQLEIGGCDAIELAREFGTPGLRRRRGRPARPRARVRRRARARATRTSTSCSRPRRSRAPPSTACSPRRGWRATSPRAASWRWRCAAASTRARIYLHGNAKSDAELREALDAGVGHVVLDSLDELDRLERVAAELRPPPGGADPRHARTWPATPTHAISTGQADSKFGFSIGAGARRDRAARRRRPHLRARRACTSTSARSCSSSSRSARAVRGDRAARRRSTSTTSAAGSGSAYTADQHPPSIEEYVDAIVDALHDELGPGKRLLLEPGRALVANSTVTLYTVQTVKRNVSTWVAVDGGMSDNLRPMLYGASYEALIADRPLADRRRALPARGQALRVRRRDRARRRCCADPAPGDVIVTPATGAYGYALANNYNGVPAAAGDLLPRRDGAGRRAPRDLRRT